jgi:hypothetical protein
VVSTLNRIVLPTSAEVSVYVAACAPLMFDQLPPILSQRVQKSLKSVGLPDHFPVSPLSVRVSEARDFQPRWSLN